MGRRKRRTAAEGPDPLDIHIGQRIRRRRLMLRLNQASIAERLGMSFQAIQKYERGDVRVAQSMAFRIARLLGVSPDYFVAELPEELGPPGAALGTDDEWIVVHAGRRSSAAVQEEEWVALRTVRPLMALPPEVRDEVIDHINGLARVLGKGREDAGKAPPHGG
jgi:transcriptional regulator with XRE-family HTH domain